MQQQIRDYEQKKICMIDQLNQIIRQNQQMLDAFNNLSINLQKIPALEQGIIDAILNPPYSSEFITTDNGWTLYRYNKTVIYTQQITYAGATTDLNINFSHAVQFQRITQMWNDSTAKDASLNVYPYASSAYYDMLDTVTANTATSRITQLGEEYRYPAGVRLNVHYANYTIGKICSVVVAVDEL